MILCCINLKQTDKLTQAPLYTTNFGQHEYSLKHNSLDFDKNKYATKTNKQFSCNQVNKFLRKLT